MPFRPGVDDNEKLLDLIDLWRDGAADIDERLADVYRGIRVELGRVGTSSNAANAVTRLRAQAGVLEELGNVSERIIDDLTQGTSRYLSEGLMDEVYAAGAGRVPSIPFNFSAPHRAAVDVLAKDTFDDVLRMTSFVDADSKRWVRRVSRKLSTFQLTGGTPVKAQARRFERELAGEFRARGIGAITYRDGSRHSFGEYSEMLLRTKTGVAHNAGTLNQSRFAGITHFELLDGALCGLTAHHDPQLANNLIVTFEIAQAYPLAHPNCRRAINPRPDITARNAGHIPSIQSPEARSDQTAFEKKLREAQQGGRRRRSRPSRSRRATRSRDRSRGSRTATSEQSGLRAQERAAAERRRERVRTLKAENEIARLEASRPVSSGKVPGELLSRWGVTEEQFLNARALTKTIRGDIRDVAKREADDIAGWLLDNDLGQLSRPTRLRRQKDQISGATRSVRSQSGYDWLEGLDDAELRRIQNRYVDSDLYTPDVVADQVRLKTGLDMTDDEALEWLSQRWLQEDGLRSVASGRIPKYGNPADMLPADYGLEGYDIERLFGVDLDDAVGHVASVQSEAAEQFARRALGSPTRGPAPWEMDAADFVRELEDLEDLVGSTQRAPGVDPGDTFRFAEARLRELSPRDIDETGIMSPFELYESIRLTAMYAGYL